MNDFKVTVEHKITEDRVRDLLIGALEGGSNGWYLITRLELPNGVSRKDFDLLVDIPFREGCGIIIDDQEGDPELCGKLLNREAMERGLKVMGEKYEWHLHDFLHENDDACTSDVFLQCCLFGDVIFG